MSIYDIDQSLLELIDPETGELLDYEAFEALQMERDTKIENMCLWVKDLTAEAEAIGKEIKSLTDRKNAAERKAERLKTYITECLGGQKFKTAKVVCTYRKSERTEVDDFFNDGRFLITKVTTSVDKVALKAALKAGENIPNARIVTTNNISIK